MKKSIVKRLSFIIVFSMVITLALNCAIQYRNTRRDLREQSHSLFLQIERLLEQNEAEANQISEDYRDMCVVRARAAAYILQYHPDAIRNQSEIDKVAALLEIDELHLFNKEGLLYAGSVPDYIGYTFNSGEQMQFFLPLLEDKTLELCQDITPNTAENKPMQYCAVWLEDGSKIVQIGMEPQRVLDAMAKVQLSYVFSLVTLDSGTELYAIDPDTGEILGSTRESDNGRLASDLGFRLSELSPDGQTSSTAFHNQIYSMTIHGQNSCCVFHDTDSVILARISPVNDIYHFLYQDTLLLTLYLALLSIVIILFITMFLNSNIIDSIYNINDRMQQISAGNLEVKMSAEPTPELTELGRRINDMVANLMDTTQKLDLVLNTVKFPVGIYNYTEDVPQVTVTGRVKEILALTDQQAERLFSDHRLFEEKIAQICQHPFDPDRNIYTLPESPSRYLHIEWFREGSSTFGIIMDSTVDVQQRKDIERQRDTDLLTGLYTRRAFFSLLERIFAAPEKLKQCAALMIDTDDLKYVNDHFGHQSGDLYLSSIAAMLRECTAPNKIVSRLSGDEFPMLIYGCETSEELMGYIAEINAMRDSSHILSLSSGETVVLRFSLGYAIYGKDARDCQALMQLADNQMYEDKKRRKEQPRS